MLFFAIALLGLVVPGLLLAHPEPLDQYSIEAYRLDHVPPPQIDGRLDDSAWQQAQAKQGFRQLEPQRGAPATDDTEFYILYDRYYLYVGFRCYDSAPDKIINRMGRRGDIFPSDWLSFYIDPLHDHRTGYKFSTTPGGIQQDEYRFDDSNSDRNWRGIWWVEAQIDAQGWTAEFKIPFANFRFPEGQAQHWGFDVERFNKRKSEVSVWKQMTQAGRRTRMSDLGHIAGLGQIESGKLFELTPYGLGGVASTDGASTQEQAAAGLDLQYNLTPALKANLTVNPDFAQVEADQVEVNLTRFPTRFDEQRPFFVEGNSFFETPLDLFFSRRIGSRGDILWGAKMTGKVGDYSIGLLGSQTGGGWLDVGSRSLLRQEAVYGAVRLKKDVLRRSNVGLLYAAKEVDGGHSRVGGVDANVTFAGTYQLTGQYAMSFDAGPDKRNRAINLELSQRNFLWDAELELERVEPLFEINQTGFLRKEPFRGWQQLELEVNYGPRWGPHEVFVSGEGRLTQSLYDGAYFTAWRADHAGLELAPDFTEDLIGWEGEVVAGMDLTESLLGSFGLAYERSRQIELTDVFTANEYYVFAETNSARPVALEVEGAAGDFFNFARQAVGRQRQVSLFGTMRPHDHLALEVGGTLARTLARDGVVDGRFAVGSLRLTYLFTRDAFLRIFTQTDRQRQYTPDKTTTADHLFSALFGWEYSPKSHFFIAYNEHWGDARSDGRVLLLKLSYLANL